MMERGCLGSICGESILFLHGYIFNFTSNPCNKLANVVRTILIKSEDISRTATGQIKVTSRHLNLDWRGLSSPLICNNVAIGWNRNIYFLDDCIYICTAIENSSVVGPSSSYIYNIAQIELKINKKLINFGDVPCMQILKFTMR